MSFELSTEGDLAAVADGLAAVEFRRREGTAPQTLVRCLRRAVRLREAEASGGRYTAADTVWHLDAAQLPLPPRPGDLLRDPSGTTWTILDAARAALGDRWQCHARALAVAPQLDTLVTIQRAAARQGSHGEPRLDWRDWRTNVRAHVQPLAAEPSEAHAARFIRRSHRAYLAEPLELDELTRLVHRGAIFQIVAVRRDARIDALTEVDLLESPWPLGPAAEPV